MAEFFQRDMIVLGNTKREYTTAEREWCHETSKKARQFLEKMKAQEGSLSDSGGKGEENG